VIVARMKHRASGAKALFAKLLRCAKPELVFAFDEVAGQGFQGGGCFAEGFEGGEGVGDELFSASFRDWSMP
jgi:hypothetical protein